MRVKFMIIICVTMIMCVCLSALAEEEPDNTAVPDTKGKPFAYNNDPMKDPDTAKDIIVNPKAVYGYSPNPESKRLGQFAKFDWTDREFVAEARQTRLEYYKNVDELIVMTIEMNGEGKSIEEIARAVSTQRNKLRFRNCKTDKEIQMLKESNLAEYGNEEGPTPDFLFKKYGKWEIVLLRSFILDPGIDACTGLYDHSYKYNLLLRHYIEEQKAA